MYVLIICNIIMLSDVLLICLTHSVQMYDMLYDIIMVNIMYIESLMYLMFLN